MIKRVLAILTAVACLALTTTTVFASSAAGITASVGPSTMISSSCSGQNAEVMQAVDRALQYLYETWMGCKGIAFARSLDGGKTFETPISVPGSIGSNVNVWDPAVTVGADGTVYSSFMIAKGSDWYPVVAASHDHGMSFDQVSSVFPADHKNWGDRDFLATDPKNPKILYLSWDYGPERTSVSFICTSSGSCAFATGDLNVVVQKSTDGGITWSHYVPINSGSVPITLGGFPASGGDSAPLFVEPSGRIDLIYQGYTITSTTTYTMNPAHTYYTSSVDGGATWSPPVRVGPVDLTMSLAEWWIDGSLAVDADGNLYATWDTQGSADIGWLSFSTDHGQTWSPLVQVTEGQSPPLDTVGNPLGHIMEVAAGAPGIAYVGWLSAYSPFVAPNSPPSVPGYAQYLRAFSITRGWLTGPIQVSTQFGAEPVWPGDTFGISTLSASKVALSWGSGVSITGQPKSEIFAADVDFQLR